MQSLQTINHADEWSVMREQAAMLVKSGLLPPSIKTPENAIAVILMGRELGIGTMAALQSINVIQNKPTISPQLMLALINRSGQLADMKIEQGADFVTVMMTRKGRTPHKVRFGKDEAQGLQLAGKDNYKKQALTMYQWRAVAMCARAVFPDVILGLYLHDELGADVDAETGELAHLAPTSREIDAIYSPPQLVPAPEEEPAESIQETHEKLNKMIVILWDDLGRNAESLNAWIEKKFGEAMSLDQLKVTDKKRVVEALTAKRAKMEEDQHATATA